MTKWPACPACSVPLAAMDSRVWLAAIMKSDLPPETKRVARAMASAAVGGVVTDADVAQVLHELDTEASR